MEEKKGDFKAVSVSNFRERMLQEEKLLIEEEVGAKKPLPVEDTS